MSENKKVENKKASSWMSDVKIPQNVLAGYPVQTFTNKEAQMFKDLIDLSNNVAGLLKQKADAELGVARGKAIIKNMREGKIKSPAMQKVSSNLYLPMYDMSDVANKISEECKLLEQATIITQEQLRQRYDEYIDAIRAFKALLDAKLANAPKQELTTLRADRKARMHNDEKVIFEKKVEEMTKKDVDFLKEIAKKNTEMKKEKEQELKVNEEKKEIDSNQK